MKAPHQPQVGKALNAPQGIGIAVFRLENHRTPQPFHQPRLPGNAKLGGKFAFDAGYWVDLQLVVHVRSSRFFRIIVSVSQDGSQNKRARSSPDFLIDRLSTPVL